MKRKDKMVDAKQKCWKDLGMPEEFAHELDEAKRVLKERGSTWPVIDDRKLEELYKSTQRHLYCTKGYVAEIRKQDAGYVARFPDFPTIVVEGKTLDEAKENAAIAGRVYLCDLVKEGKDFPKPTYRAENRFHNTLMDYLTGRTNYRITFKLD